MGYKVDIPIKIRLSCNIKKKGKWFIATCYSLDLVTQGETEAMAHNNLEDAINGFLLSHPGYFTIKRLSSLKSDLYYKLY